ncbi:uncharacterized protein JN550_000765 [Neoarthrinium moseri]|uniref:uncharacterized protein n=1 Tax=Neoarthrinium moseri TaxID=1658444 RepID=UPI001FDE88E1|nr:uncharacterized protein JN550_000765 [Neoarthrinium moseri]KAI1876693.1 hypothetical protein JN550_000765 [Neoarthrinium moseri]
MNFAQTKAKLIDMVQCFLDIAATLLIFLWIPLGLLNARTLCRTLVTEKCSFKWERRVLIFLLFTLAGPLGLLAWTFMEAYQIWRSYQNRVATRRAVAQPPPSYKDALLAGA